MANKKAKSTRIGSKTKQLGFSILEMKNYIYQNRHKTPSDVAPTTKELSTLELAMNVLPVVGSW